MRETCTSGSVRGEGDNLLTYSARKGWVGIPLPSERQRRGTQVVLNQSAALRNRGC